MTSAHPDVVSVTLHFDPSCPYTWRTSRWLVDVTERHAVPLRLRPFEISAGAPVADLPEEWRARVTEGRRFLRAVDAAAADARDDITAAAYAAYGKHLHDARSDPDPALTEQVWRDAGGAAYVDALDDEARDPAVLASRTTATGLAGDDVGSPVLVLVLADGTRRGFFGPVVAPTPTAADADRLWGAVAMAAAVPQFFELKTRRTADPKDG